MHRLKSGRAPGSAAWLLLVLCSVPATATEPAAGTVMGWVEDSHGMPVSGALVSLFAKGMRGGGLVAFSDDAGRFLLPALPAGSYTIRAVGQGLKPATAQRITVLPNQESILSLSLAGLGDLTEEESAERRRELRWILRHKDRSILEERSARPQAAQSDQPSRERLLEGLAPWLPALGGSVEFVANAPALGASGDFPGGDLLPSGSGALRLSGQIGDSATFSLGGLVAESEDTQWRMATEFVVDPGGGHEIRTGAGYGTRFIRPISGALGDVALDGGSVGALFLEDRWTLSDRVVAMAGARQSYVGFVEDKNHLDPAFALEVRPASKTRVRGSVAWRTLAPGGDMLTLSTLSSAPAIVYADFSEDLRAERIVRYEMAVERSLGATAVSVRAFRESTRDQLVSAFSGSGAARSLRILNGGAVAARGIGLDVSREFGRAVRGSVGYSYGRSFRETPAVFLAELPGTRLAEGSFQDVSARLDAFVDATDTRFVAYYRVNLARGGTGDIRIRPVRNDRFDVQLSQGLPFLSPLTRADWEVLLAVRNLFYETDDGGALDELAVVNPPTRVLGGVSVRF